MKIVNREEINRIDQETCARFLIPSFTLMENAGKSIADWILQNYPQAKRIAVLAGKGNNAGDGFVAARYLSRSKEVWVFILSKPGKFKGDALLNWQILQKFPVQIKDLSLDQPSDFPNLSSFDLLVDALFGTGLKGEMPSNYREIVKTINDSNKPIISVDLPSGLDADSGKILGAAVRAHWTITMGLPKIGLLAPQASEYVGQMIVSDIGYPLELIEDEHLPGHLLEESFFHGWLKPRKKDSHKGTYGQVLVIAGSLRFPGAANLASLSALRVGAGLVKLALPRSLCLKNIRKPHEVINLPLPETEEITISSEALEILLQESKSAQAVVLGPGLTQNERTKELVQAFLKENLTPTLVDADALNAFIDNSEQLADSLCPLILTPHPGELSRLLKVSTGEIQENRIDFCLQAAHKLSCILVLKGYHTVIGDPTGNFYINPTGNPGMASGGMGDVLSGAIGGLLAQGLTCRQAALLGVYAHGKAGDIQAERIGERGLIASDLIKQLPSVLHSLQ